MVGSDWFYYCMVIAQTIEVFKLTVSIITSKSFDFKVCWLVSLYVCMYVCIYVSTF